MCRLRSLSSALPDVPSHGRRALLTAWTDRRHAIGAVGGAAPRYRRRRISLDLHPVSRLRAGLSEWGPIWSAHRRREGRHRVRLRSSTEPALAPTGSSSPRSPSTLADRITAIGRCAKARNVPTSLAPIAASCRPRPSFVDRRSRRLDLHRLRDGRLVASDTPSRGSPRHRHRIDLWRVGRRMLRRAPRAFGPFYRCPTVGPVRHGFDAGIGTDPRRFGRLWCGAQGLRPPTRNRRGGDLRLASSRRPRMARSSHGESPSDRTRPPADRHRPRTLSPSPRPTCPRSDARGRGERGRHRRHR